MMYFRTKNLNEPVADPARGAETLPSDTTPRKFSMPESRQLAQI